MKSHGIIPAILLGASFLYAEAVLVAGQAEIKSFFGTTNVRLAYVDAATVRAVDYAAASPAISELAGTTGAIAPQFSPNGAWITYGLGPAADMSNNADIASSAYLVPFAGGAPVLAVQDAAHEPRFRQHSASPELVYATQGVWMGWNGLGETRVLPVDLDGATPQFGTSSALISGSYYGGANANYIATGSNRAVMAKLGASPATPKITLGYALVNANGVVDNLERQACNTSIYPGTEFPDAMLSLDFGSGGKTNATINQGKAWAKHDILFITRYDGTRPGAFLRPERSAFATLSDASYTAHHFDDAEWSNHPYFAIANIQVSRAYQISGAWENEDKHEILLAIDLRTGKHLVLARSASVGFDETSDLQWPALWIDRSATGVPAVVSDWLLKLPSSVRPGAPAPALPSLRLQGRTLIATAPLRTVRSSDLQGRLLHWQPLDADGLSWSMPSLGSGIQYIQATSSTNQTFTTIVPPHHFRQ